MIHVLVEDDEKQQFARRLADRKHEVQMRKQETEALKAMRDEKVQLVEQVLTFLSAHEYTSSHCRATTPRRTVQRKN